MRYQTIREVDDAGLDLRVWCLECARGDVIYSGLWEDFERRGRSIDMIEARRHFGCKVCKSHDHVLIVPATPQIDPKMTWERVVVGFFHANRAAGKKRRRLG